MKLGLFPIALISLFVSLAAGAIYEYNDVPLENLFLKYRTSYMYSEFDTPASNGDGAGFLKFDFTFTMADNFQDDMDDVLVQVTVFPVEDTYLSSSGETLGIDNVLEFETFCCSEEQAIRGDECYETNTIYSKYLDVENSDLMSYYALFERASYDEGDELSIDIRGTFPIKKKGIYVLMFSYCQKVESTVYINGHSTWMNPYGHLPAELYGFLTFYWKISVGYVILACIWGYLSYKHWRNLLLLQNWITCVLVLGMIEVNLRYFDFYSLNKGGIRNHSLMVFALLFLAIKKAVSRILVLVVSMGFGVVRPTLGEEKSKIFNLGGTYFALAFLEAAVSSYNSTSQGLASPQPGTHFFRFLFEIPLVFLDAYLFYWIFKSLGTTLLSLEKRGQEVKHGLYKKFKNLLFATVGVAILWAVVATIVKVNLNSLLLDPNGMTLGFNWENLYMLEVLWDMNYLVILMAIMFLWRPNDHNIQYSYTHTKKQYDPTDEFDDGLSEDDVDVKLYRSSSSGESKRFVQKPQEI